MHLKSKIFFKSFEIKAHIGIHEWERRILQTVLIDLEISIDIEKIAQFDHIDYTLDYVNLAKKIEAEVQPFTFHLIETLAYKIVKLLEQQNIKHFQLRLAKPHIFNQAESVGISVQRDGT